MEPRYGYETGVILEYTIKKKQSEKKKECIAFLKCSLRYDCLQQVMCFLTFYSFCAFLQWKRCPFNPREVIWYQQVAFTDWGATHVASI